MFNLPLMLATLGSVPLLFLATLAALIYSLIGLALPHAGAQQTVRSPQTPPGTTPARQPVGPNVAPFPPAEPRQLRTVAAHHGPGRGPYPPRPTAPDPAPAGMNSDTSVYANILLGVAATFLVIAAFIFVGIAEHALLRGAAVISTGIITYGAGLLISLLSSRLKPVGIALTAVGLVLLPVSGAALGGLGITGAKTAWLAASAFGLVSCALAAALLRSEFVTWFGLLFLGSTVLSAINFGGPSFAYYGVGLVIASMLFIVVGRVLEGPAAAARPYHSRGAAGFRSFLSAARGQQVHWARPFSLLGQIIAPASGVCALITLPDDSPWAKGVFWLVLTVFYIVLGTCRSWTYALGAAVLASTIGITTLTGSICRTTASPEPTAGGFVPTCSVTVSTAGIAAGFIQILILTAVLPLFARRGRQLTLLIALYISTAILTVSILALRVTSRLGAVSSSTQQSEASFNAMAPSLLAAGVILFLAGLVCAWSAWQSDSVFLQAASALSLASAPILAAGFSDLTPPWTSSAVLLVMSTVMVVGHGALSFASRTEAGRQRRQLRSTSTVCTTVISIAGGLPFTFLVWADNSTLWLWIFFAASAAAAAIFAGAAFLFRSAVMSLAALCAAFGASAALGFIISRSAGVNYSAAVFIPLAGIGSAVLWAVSHRLRLKGRARRAQAAYAMSIVWATAAASGVFRHTFFGTDGRVLSASIVMITAGVAALAAAAGTQGAVSYLRRKHPAEPGRLRLFAVPVLIFTCGLWAVQTTRFLGVPAAVIATAFALTAVAIAWMSVSLSIQWLQLAAGLTLFMGLFSVFGELTKSFSLGMLLASWGVWAVSYAGHWVLILFNRKILASLITAGLALLMALFAQMFVTVDRGWLENPKRAAAGLTFAILALMVFGAARFLRNPSHRLGCREGASYLGAVAVMLAIDGFIDSPFVVLWHVPTAVAVTWGLVLARRARNTPWSPPSASQSFTVFDVRILVAWMILTAAGIVAAATGPGWLTVLFLADHAVLLAIGALTSRQYALWWGLIACAFAVFWGLRSLIWLALVLLALMLIGVVVWMLLRPKKPKPPQGVPGGAARPHPSGPAGPRHAPHPLQPQSQQISPYPPAPRRQQHGPPGLPKPPGPFPPGPAPRPSQPGMSDTAPPPGPGFSRDPRADHPGQ